MSVHPVLVHYHIFKNAGVSVDFALGRSFGSRWTTFEGRRAFDYQTAEQLGAFLRDHPGIWAVSSHQARPPLPFPHCRPIVFLRHPLLRTRSAYEFLRRNPELPDCPVSARKSFPTFVEWALTGEIIEGAGIIRDFQVSSLTNLALHPDIRTQPARPQHLVEAQALLKSWGIFGIVEEYAESARRFQATYGPEFPDLDFVDVRRNRTSNRIPDIERDTHEIKTELGSELFERLVEANQLDLALYGWAEEEFSSAHGRSRRSKEPSKSDRLEHDNEKLRHEIRYLASEGEVLTASLRELTAQNKQLLNLRRDEIAQHDALAHAHGKLSAQYDELLSVRADELKQYKALADAHDQLVARYDELVWDPLESTCRHASLSIL